jgi:hypothetical protein
MQKQLTKFYNHLQSSPLAAELEKENEERDDVSVVEYSEREEPSSRREGKRGIKRTLSEVLDEHKENFDQVDAFELSVDTPDTKSRKRKRVSFAGEAQMMQETEERDKKRRKLEGLLSSMTERMQNQETDAEVLGMLSLIKQEIDTLISTPQKRPPSATKYATTSKLKTSSSRTDHTKGRTVASKELFKSPAKPDTVFKTPEKPTRPRSNPSSTKKTPSKPEAIDLDRTNDSVSINNSVDEQAPHVEENDFEEDIAIESAQRVPPKAIESTPSVDKAEAKKSTTKQTNTPKKGEKATEEKVKEKTAAKQAKQTKGEEQVESKSKAQKPVEKSKPEESKRRDSLRSSQERKQTEKEVEDKASMKKGESTKDKKEKAREESKTKDKKDKTVRQTNSDQAESVVSILDSEDTKKPSKEPSRPTPGLKKSTPRADDDDATQIVGSGKSDKKSKPGSAKSNKSQEGTENEEKTSRSKRKRESTEDSDEEKTPPKKARKGEDKKEGMEKSGSFSVVRSGKKHQSILFTRNAEHVGTVVIEDSQSSQAQADSQRRSGRINKSKSAYTSLY